MLAVPRRGDFRSVEVARDRFLGWLPGQARRSCGRMIALGFRARYGRRCAGTASARLRRARRIRPAPSAHKVPRVKRLCPLPPAARLPPDRLPRGTTLHLFCYIACPRAALKDAGRPAQTTIRQAAPGRERASAILEPSVRNSSTRAPGTTFQREPFQSAAPGLNPANLDRTTGTAPCDRYE